MSDEELKSLFEALRQDNAALRQESAAAWRTNEARWEENVAAWRANEARWQQNDARWQENAAAHVETRRHFDVALEAFKAEVRLVAEGVALTRQERARVAAGLGERIDRVASRPRR